MYRVVFIVPTEQRTRERERLALDNHFHKHHTVNFQRWKATACT